MVFKPNLFHDPVTFPLAPLMDVMASYAKVQKELPWGSTAL